jgi:hypothetical protein
LGHIISKNRIKIDPSRIEAIQKLEHPRNIKELQSFIGKIKVCESNGVGGEHSGRGRTTISFNYYLTNNHTTSTKGEKTQKGHFHFSPRSLG